MRVEGKSYRTTHVDQIVMSERYEEHLRFSKQLENCLLEICKQLDIGPPLWMEKNTREFARFRQTVFYKDQFMEEVRFDRLEIKLLEDREDEEK